MERFSYFDLSLTSDGNVYDISFIEEKLLKDLELTKICDNPLIEQCEEKEETLKINDDYSEEEEEEEEDKSIIKLYEGVRYVSFPGIDSVYTEKDLRYVGRLLENHTGIDFTPI